MVKTNFNHGWVFCDVEEGQDAFAGAPQMTPVDLPHDAMAARERKPGIPGGAAAGQYENKNTLYEKHFSVPADCDAQQWWIEFEGVYANTSVFLNGNYLGGCHYGYTDFYLDAGESVVKGGENVLQVYTKTGMGMVSRWYTGDGIYRSVWLYSGPKTSLQPGSSRV